MRDEDIATDVAAAIKIKGQTILRRSLAETLKRTRNAVRGDSAFHLVSISQTLTRCCRLTVHKSVPAVRIHLAPPSSPSIFGLVGESIEIGASARDLRSRMDPESGYGCGNRRIMPGLIRLRFS